MVAEHKIVLEFYDSLHIVWVTFSQKQQKFGFYSCLIVVFLLIFDEFDSN